MKKLWILGLPVAFLLAAAHISGGQRLTIRASPAVALAPAFVTVRTTIEPSDENRLLRIEIESPTYRRSSDIPLDGKNAPRTSVLEIKGLPTGLYEVRAVLVGPSGPIATTMQLVKVDPSAGHTY